MLMLDSLVEQEKVVAGTLDHKLAIQHFTGDWETAIVDSQIHLYSQSKDEMVSDHPVLTPSPSPVQGGVKEHSMGKFLKLLVVPLISPDGTAGGRVTGYFVIF